MQQPTNLAAGAILEAAGHGVSATTLPVLADGLDRAQTSSTLTASPTNQQESPGTKSMEVSPKQDPAGLQPRPRQSGACEEEPEEKEEGPSLNDIAEKAFQALKAKHENNKCCQRGRGGRGLGRGSAGKTAAAKAAGKGRGEGRGGKVSLKSSVLRVARLDCADFEIVGNLVGSGRLTVAYFF